MADFHRPSNNYVRTANEKTTLSVNLFHKRQVVHNSFCYKNGHVATTTTLVYTLIIRICICMIATMDQHCHSIAKSSVLK